MYLSQAESVVGSLSFGIMMACIVSIFWITKAFYTASAAEWTSHMLSLTPVLTVLLTLGVPRAQAHFSWWLQSVWML